MRVNECAWCGNNKIMSYTKTLRTYISTFLFLTVFSALYARTITFPVNGLMMSVKEPVPVDLEWDENILVAANPKVYNHQIARLSAMLSTISYVHVEENPDSNEMLKSYEILGFKKSDIYWNYNLDYNNHIDKNDQAAYSFAFKDIQTPAGIKKLVFLIIRGTPLSANEWHSNLNISNSSKENVMIHEGFLSTCEIIKADFYRFLKENSISKEDSYFLITGHSRGAAIANLLGAILYDEQEITSSKIFVYTFASPNVSQDMRTFDEKYNFIWNIVNAEDAVPSVPPNRGNWQWKKFGQTRYIVNYWNCDSQKYISDYLPRMNEYYKKLLFREYAPFKTGPFLPIQASRVLTGVFNDIEHYYGLGLHFMAGVGLDFAFPNEKKAGKDYNEPEEKKLPLILRPLRYKINKNYDNGFEYIINAAVDMHACESYLSWLLALNEDEIFASLGSSEIVIGGAIDCAIYDNKGKLLAKVINGAVDPYSMCPPAFIMPLPYHNVLGFPANQELNVIIHKDSLVRTGASYKIEQYDVSGKLLSTSEKSKLKPSSSRSYKFEVGPKTLEATSLDCEELTRKEAKSLVKKYGLNENFKFMIEPEISLSFDKILNGGFRIGAPVFYGTVLGEIHSTKSYGLATGIGHQHIIYGRVLFDTEIFARYVWTKTDSQKEFDIVPEARLSLSYKPLRRGHYFMAVTFDMHIDDYNNTAFTSTARSSHFGTIRLNDKAELQPAISIGARY